MGDLQLKNASYVGYDEIFQLVFRQELAPPHAGGNPDLGGLVLKEKGRAMSKQGP